MFNTMGNPLKVVSDLREEVEQHRRHADDLQATIDALTEELRSRDALITQQENQFEDLARESLDLCTRVNDLENQLGLRMDQLQGSRRINSELNLDLLMAQSRAYRLANRGLFARIFNTGVA